MGFTLAPGAAQAAPGASQSSAIAPAASTYRMVATRNAATVTGMLALGRKSGLSDPKRCYTIYVARHSARYAALTYSRWAWSHKAYDGSGPCHPGEGGVSLARKVGTMWRWTGAFTGGGDVRSQCISRARAKSVPLLVAKDFCVGSWVG